MTLSDGPAGGARYWVPEEWGEPDSYVAKLADCSKETVRRARQELEAVGIIPPRESGMSDDAYRPPGLTHFAAQPRGLTPQQRARLELEADPGASNNRIAERAQCAPSVVHEAAATSRKRA